MPSQTSPEQRFAARQQRIAASRGNSPAPAASRPSVYTSAETSNLEQALDAALARERARIRSILESPEAKGREESARTIALSSSIGSAAARQLLATLQQDGQHDVDAAVAKIIAFARQPRPG